MSRLPQPGGDAGVWGDVLNEYLSQVHKPDGTLKDDVVTSAAIAADAVNATSIVNGAITEVLLSSAVQIKLNADATNSTKGKIQLTGDLGGTADSPAVVRIQGTNVNSSTPSDGQVMTYSTASGSWVPGTVSNTPVNDATTGSKGIIQLDGDLGGTASSPTVPGLATKEPALTGGTINQYYRGDKSWQTLNKTAVGLGNVDNTSDATKNSDIATLTNKTISGSNNTFLNIPESAVTNLATDLAGKANVSHMHTASQISDSTAIGQSVLTAVDGAAARAAIGAGTSNLAIGTTSNTAKAGDYVPVWTEIASRPTSFAPSDGGTAGLINDSQSSTRAALDSLYTVPTEVRTGAAPVGTVHSDAGTGAVITSGGTRIALRATITTGTAPVSGGTLATFALAGYTLAPVISVNPRDETSAATFPYAFSSSTVLSLKVAGELEPNTAYTYDLIIMGV